MPNEGPYGGKIIVQQDENSIPIVSWQASARVFSGSEDNLGSLDYAVRLVDANNTMAASYDLKCLVKVKDRPVKPTVDTRVLIVSGYDLPHGEDSRTDRSRILGKAYFITAAAYDPDGPLTEPYAQFPIRYDVTLQFDNDDLNKLGLREAAKPSQLSLCYVQWRRMTYLDPVGKNVALMPLGEEEIKTVRNELRDLVEKLQQAIDDKCFTQAADCHGEIEKIEKRTGRRLVSIWRQKWKPVFNKSDPSMQPRQSTKNVDGTLTEPIVVSVEAITKIPCTQYVTATGLSQPAHLGIMYHDAQ